MLYIFFTFPTVEFNAQLSVSQANLQIALDSIEHLKKVTYAVLAAVSGLLCYCVISNGRLAPGSILFKFTFSCFTDYTEDEVVELLNNYFRGGKEVYYKDFEATVDLINDTIIGK